MDLFGSVVIGNDKVDNVDNVNVLGFRGRVFDDIVEKIVKGLI
jgi:DNA polymerase II small subunit/DNA polymerase delta subunit B